MRAAASIILLSFLVASGCSSKLIEHPGLKATFIWEDTGQPIANAEVVYKHIANDFSIKSETDEGGTVLIEPTFTRGFSGYPVTPVSLQVSWELLLREKHNPSGAYLFVNNTDIDSATIDAGVIKVNAIFRAEKGTAPDADERQ